MGCAAVAGALDAEVLAVPVTLGEVLGLGVGFELAEALLPGVGVAVGVAAGAVSRTSQGGKLVPVPN